MTRWAAPASAFDAVGSTLDPAAWSPNRFQSKFLGLWLERWPIIAAMGGWGIGKTALVGMLMQFQAETQPGVNGAYVTDSMGRGGKTVGQEIMKRLAPVGWTFHGASAGAPAPHWRSPVYGGRSSTVWAMSWKRHSTQDKSANSLEGPDLGWLIIDECNAHRDEEVAAAALGRIRSGPHPQLALLGKPSFNAWWLKFAEARGGVAFRAPSSCNRENLLGWDAWISTLSPRELEENVLCRPQPPEGAVFSDWRDEAFPAGNLAPPGWRPAPGMRTWVAMDFGVRSPSALVISHDPSLGPEGADVVWAEAHPDDASIHDVCRMLTRYVWPASHRNPPPGTIPLHGGGGDKAGRNRTTTMATDLKEVAERPEHGGLGIRLSTTTDPDRVDIPNGIRLMSRLILTTDGRRRLLCCPKLWRAGLDGKGRSFAKSITGYRWATGGGREIPLKDDVNDHACFPAGTMVETEHGPAPIETIRPGDLVWTRAGLRRVSDARLTRVDATLIQCDTVQGRRVLLTPDHKVWSGGRWVAAADLKPGDEVIGWQSTDPQRSLSSTGSPTADTPSRKTGGSGCTSRATGGTDDRRTCTGPSTSSTTGPSPTATSSTTPTATRSTTTSTTSPHCQSASTSPGTPLSFRPTPRMSSGSGPSSMPLDRSLLCGTEATPGESGTGTTGAACSPTVRSSSARASSAARRSEPESWAHRASAPTTARPSGDTPAASTTRTASVPPAARPSQSTSTSPPRTAPDAVLRKAPAGRSDVYGLTVEGEHEYFAGGLLVKNCDALRYWAVNFRWPGAIDLSAARAASAASGVVGTTEVAPPAR